MSQTAPSGFNALPRAARLYICGVLLAGPLGVALACFLEGGLSELDPWLLLAAALACAAGGMFEVFAPGSYSLQPNLVFFFGASVLLPPAAIALLAVVCFTPELVSRRVALYKSAFNVANYLLSGLAAHLVVTLAGGFEAVGAPLLGALLAAAGLAAVVNHALLVVVVGFAQETPLRRALPQITDGLPLDTALTLTGACLAALWYEAPPLAVLALAPMILIYRALAVPMLEHRVRTDPKTGLFNFEHLREAIAEELDAARRHGTDLSVVMVDLDHLRTINNAHGHLVGDRVIQAVADVLGEAVGPLGIAARFGGEEFCLLLPGVRPGAARDIVEAARARVATLEFADERGTHVRPTLSAGVAAYPEHDDTVDGLLKAADDAVYDAKTGGRNRVRVALAARARAALHEGLRPGRPYRARPGALDQPATAGRGGAAPSPSADAPLAAAGRPIAPGSPDVSWSGRDAAWAEPALAALAPARAPEAPFPGAGTSGLDEHEAVSSPDEPASAQSGPPPRPLALLAVGVCLAATAAAATSSLAPVLAAPLLFGLLVAAVVGLDLVNIDLFERGKISPGSVPSLALAFAFGPLGPLTAELIAAARRFAQRESPVSWGIDLGNLSLAGAAAAWAFELVPNDGPTLTMAAATVGGMAYYAVNGALLSLVWRLAEGVAPLAAWRERFAWAWWHYLGYGALAGAFVLFEHRVGLAALAALTLPVFMLWLSQKQYIDRSRTSVEELRRSHDDLEHANVRLQRLLDDNEELLGRMHQSYLSTITSLARTIEAKDPYTGGHTDRVAQIASLIARELGLNESELRALEVGAVIHDIGKIGIPDSILLKPGRLTETEFEKMRRHPEISSYIVAELELPPIVKQVVRNHHERYDGRGYPDGLAGEEIPIAARILTVADAFDAMTSDRPYRAALPLAAARAELASEAGRQFCPRVVEALTHSFERAPELWLALDDRATVPASD